MHPSTRNLIAAAALALLAGCAATGDTTGEQQTAADTQTDAATQPSITAQPGQDAYSYAYSQAPSQEDAYDTTGGGAVTPGGGQPSQAVGGGAVTPGGGQPSQAVASGGNAAAADRVVYFSFDSAEILPESQAVVTANARTLTSNPRIITQLEGHTDERGSREYNIALGERRANAVRQSMIAMGVSPQQIRIVSFGEERPAASGQSEQSYALNRRVEIVY